MAKPTYSNQEIEDSIKNMLWRSAPAANAQVNTPKQGSSRERSGHDDVPQKLVNEPKHSSGRERIGRDAVPQKSVNEPKQNNSREHIGRDDVPQKSVNERRQRRSEASTGFDERSDSAAAKKKKKKKKPKKKRAEGEEDNGGNTRRTDGSHNRRPKPRNSEDDRMRNDDDRLLHQFSGLAMDEPRPSDEVLLELEAERLFPLRKRSVKFPRARFFCRLCDYHCDTVEICQKHIKDTRHKRLKLIRTTDILLKSLPAPSKPHLEALTKLIETVYEQQMLPEDEIKFRTEIFEKISEAVHSKLPEAKLSIYGSTAAGFALKDSDFNIDMSVNEAAKGLMAVHLMLKDDESGYFQQVQSDFTAKIPCIYFHVSGSDTRCQLSVNSQVACQTSELLKCYAGLDLRVKIIAVAFRYWAKIIKIDQQERGTLPSYVFGLMVIYYMQQCQPPVLPVLHEKTDWTTHNKMSVGELWVGLLKFYSVQLDLNKMVVCIRRGQSVSREEKKWASKKLAIEDPFSRKRNVARSVSHSHVFEFIYDRLRAAFQYFGIPQTKNGPLYSQVDSIKLESKLRDKYKRLDREANEISADSPIVKEKEVSPTAKAPVVESVVESVEHDLDSSSMDQEVETLLKPKVGSDEYTDEIINKTKQLVITHDDFIDKFAEVLVEDIIKRSLEQIIELRQKRDVPSDRTDSVDNENEGQSGETTTEQLPVSNEFDALSKVDADASESESEASDNDSENQSEDETETDLKGRTEEACKVLKDSPTKDYNNLGDPDDSIVHDLYDDKLALTLSSDDLIFRFDVETLSDGKGPAVMCSICQTEGHLKQNCPEENLPELKPLPPMSRQFKTLLDDILFQIPGDFEPNNRERKNRASVTYEIEEYIRDEFTDARLSLFGSSVNGFGFRQSDMDICMTFDGDAFEDVPHVDIIEKLAKKLRGNKSLYDVIPICTAKVPIVKFKHRRSKLEGDISLYNTLAQHNTHMLQLYSEIDFRVKVLGYTMKVFAKICDMCDASRGSLSSYGYILMVLYFLQQRKPPVIPVLQELYEDDEKPTLTIDGWNAWFFKDVDNLKANWIDFDKNKESLAELWVGMLRFYTEEFNFKDYVISIRQLAPLSRFEKLWNGKCFAIEDPFDLNHNLGAGVSRKMNTYIMKAFINARSVFGTPVNEIPERYRHIQDYLFDKHLLTDSEPPNDRGCRVCGKIGHFAKECPRVQARKERQMKEREQQREERQKREQDRAADYDHPSLSGGQQHRRPSGEQHQRLSAELHRRSSNEQHRRPSNEQHQRPSGGQQSQQGARNKPQPLHGSGRGGRQRGSDSVGSGGHPAYGSPGRSHSPHFYYNSNLQNSPMQRQAQHCDGMAFLNSLMDMATSPPANFTWQQEKFLPSQQMPGATHKPNATLNLLSSHQHQSHLASVSSQSHHPVHPSISLPHYQRQHQHKHAGARTDHPAWLPQPHGQSFMHQNSPPNQGPRNPPNQHVPPKFQKMGQNNPHRRQRPQGQSMPSDSRQISAGRNIEVTVNNEFYQGGGHRQQAGGHYGGPRHSGQRGNHSQRYHDGRNYNR